MSSEQSIYERIRVSITDEGKLPSGFTLDEPAAPNQLHYAPGMIDGCGVYTKLRSTKKRR